MLKWQADSASCCICLSIVCGSSLFANKLEHFATQTQTDTESESETEMYRSHEAELTKLFEHCNWHTGYQCPAVLPTINLSNVCCTSASLDWNSFIIKVFPNRANTQSALYKAL